MSKITNETIICPCGTKFNIERYDSVNGLMDPEAVQKIIDGTLFEVSCPACKHKIKLVYSVLYNSGMCTRPMIQYYPYDNIDEMQKKYELSMKSVEKMFQGIVPKMYKSLNKTVFTNNYDEFVKLVKEISHL